MINFQRSCLVLVGLVSKKPERLHTKALLVCSMFMVFIYIIAVFCFLLLVPSAPTISEIKHISSSTVDIKWNKPSHPNGVILGYKLHYKKLSDDNYTDVYVHADVRNIILTKLGLYYLIFINVPPRIMKHYDEG